MSLEQSIDHLSTLIEQLITQLETGRSAGQVQALGPPPGQTAKAKPTAAPEPASASPSESPSNGTSSSGGTKSSDTSTAPADTGASTGLDYVRDVAPRFSLLVAKNRPAALDMIQRLTPGAKKLSEAIHEGEYVAVLAEINALLGE